jgi:hypothetical protein
MKIIGKDDSLDVAYVDLMSCLQIAKVFGWNGDFIILNSSAIARKKLKNRLTRGIRVNRDDAKEFAKYLKLALSDVALPGKILDSEYGSKRDFLLTFLKSADSSELESICEIFSKGECVLF